DSCPPMSIVPKTDVVAGLDDPGNASAARTENESTAAGGRRVVVSQNEGAAVAGVVDPGSGNAKTAANDRGYNLPNSRKIYVAGRPVTPADNGWLSDAHAKHAQRSNGSSKSQAPSSKKTPNFNLQSSIFAARKPLRAKSGNCVTQLAYARRGIITPEMEFIAI